MIVLSKQRGVPIMNKLFPSSVLILSWTLMIGLLLDSVTIFSESNSDSLLIVIRLYLLALGSFILIKLPESQSNQSFLYLTTAMAFLFLFMDSSETLFKLLGFFFFCLSPVLLYLFLNDFIQPTNQISFQRNLFLFVLVALFSFLSLAINFYPKMGLLLLVTFSSITSHLTLKKTKQLFFNPFSYKFLNFSIFSLFIPLALSYALPNLFSKLIYLNHFFVPLLLTCIAFILMKDQLLMVPMYLFESFIILISSFFITFAIHFLGISTTSLFLTFFQIIFTTSFTLFLVKKWQILSTIQQQKQQKNFSNEKIELLNQATYADFLNQASRLLVARLFELTESKHLLLLSEKHGNYLTLCQKGIAIQEDVEALIPNLSLKSQSITLQKITFQTLRIQQSEEILWLFFEKSSKEILDDEIIAFLQQYSVITKTVRMLHHHQKQYVEAPLNTSTLLQEKLFNSLELEKKKQTNYLHDDVLQTIIALNTLVTHLDGDLEMKQLITIEFSKLIYSIRRQIFDITPSTLYHISFDENIRILVEDFNQRYPDITFRFEYEKLTSLPRHLIPPAYRMIKELNENIGKHSKGTQAKTRLQTTKERLTMIVEDNGIGIENLEVLELELMQKKEHIGLLSIKNDVNWLNGTFQLLLPDDSFTGTLIKITIPLSEREDLNENTFDR